MATKPKENSKRLDNIYLKLANARTELQNLELKKSGENKYSGFTYYELGDFLPAINELCDRNGMLTRFNIIKDGEVEKAILTIFNIEEPSDKIEFVSPTAEARIGVKKDGTGGADPIQNLGGKITYMRRYMIMTAFEMVESDRVEMIRRELSDEVSEEDKELLRSSKNRNELQARAKELMNKYKKSLIAPLYKELEKDLIDEEEVEKEGQENE